MEKRQLGSSDLRLTNIGLGTWAMGGSNWRFSWGYQDDQNSINAIHKALELGINWIDTAAVYGLGHAEEVLARAIKNAPQKPHIATKCGRFAYQDGSLYGNLRKKSIRQEVEDSLRRLAVEVIDLYQIHWPDPDEQIEEGWTTITELAKAGKIRYAGVSNFNLDQLKRIQSIYPVTSLQPPYSMVRRELETNLLEFCQKNNIGIIVYSPMQKGLLTDKTTDEWIGNIQSNDHRINDPNFQQPRLKINLELINNLKHFTKKYQCSLAQLSIAWTIRNPAVTAAIVGTRNPDQISETVHAGALKINKEDLLLIEDLLQTYDKKIKDL